MLNDFLVVLLAALINGALMLAAQQYFGWWREPLRCVAGGAALGILVWVVMDGPVWTLLALAAVHVGALLLMGQQVARPAAKAPRPKRVEPVVAPTPWPASTVADSLGFERVQP